MANVSAYANQRGKGQRESIEVKKRIRIGIQAADSVKSIHPMIKTYFIYGN